MEKRYYMRDDFETGPKRPRTTGIIFICIFLLIIVLIGLYVLGASSKKSSSPIVPTTAVTPTAIPVVTQADTPTPEPTGKVSPTPTGKVKTTPTPTPVAKGSVDRSKLEIAVLNGSGVGGAAKGISTYLSDLGYTVKTVGNADAFDYKGLTILVTKANSSYLSVLKKDLAQKSASISASINDSIATDAQVIVGK